MTGPAPDIGHAERRHKQNRRQHVPPEAGDGKQAGPCRSRQALVKPGRLIEGQKGEQHAAKPHADPVRTQTGCPGKEEARRPELDTRPPGRQIGLGAEVEEEAGSLQRRHGDRVRRMQGNKDQIDPERYTDRRPSHDATVRSLPETVVRVP